MSLLLATFSATTLTGVLATGQVGTFVPAAPVPISGVFATGQVGGFAPDLSFTLTGVSATGAAGNFVFASAASGAPIFQTHTAVGKVFGGSPTQFGHSGGLAQTPRSSGT